MATKVGSNGRDILRGTASRDTLTGLGGPDDLYGLAGNDLLKGGPGNDKLFGGPGNDTLLPGAGTDTLNGGPGTDTVSYADAAAGVNVDIYANTASGAAAGDGYTSVEIVIGSRFIDSLVAGPGQGAYGGAGLDIIQMPSVSFSGPGATLRGDDGNDFLQTDPAEHLNDRVWLQYDRGMDFVEFTIIQDKLLVSARDFALPAALAGGTLPVAYMTTSLSPLATQPQLRFIIETDTRILWADRDGSGTRFHSIPIADFSQSPFDPSNTDFLVIA